jgi:uncharacterized protein DUF5672
MPQSIDAGRMHPGRLQLDRVSLLCVETRRPQLALHAMERCMREIDFGECLLLGATPIAPHPRIRHVPIRNITSVAQYSEFMVRRLGDYFSLDHVLVVQWDGFVTSAGSWDQGFLDYDYIGAPWTRHPLPVGNGGFSLRSRRLVDALQRIDTPITHPEDLAICTHYRPQLEQHHGIRFAPVDVAKRFSWEETAPASPTFGFHAFFNFHRALPEAELVEYFRDCDDTLLQSVPARRLLKNLYRAGMYVAAAELLRLRMRGSLGIRLDAAKLRSIAWLRNARRATFSP